MPKLLHAMCGNNDKSRTTKVFAQNEWTEVRLDPHPANKPDIEGDLRALSTLEDKSFDAILTHHSLERLYPHEVGKALAEMYRVLNDEGYLLLTCADLQTACQLIADDKFLEPAYESPAGPISPIDILYGFRPAVAAGHMNFANHCGFTSKALIGTLAQVGFASVWTARNPEIVTIAAIATKQQHTEEYLKNLATQHFS